MRKKPEFRTLTALSVIAAVGAGGLALTAEVTSGQPFVRLMPMARAQSNPCAPANPCAAQRPAAANPCAPANPCAAAKPASAMPAVTAKAANPFDVPSGVAQAPFGDKMPEIVDNYLRAAPAIGTGGLVKPGAYPQIKTLGFKTVVNLLTAKEGAEEEGKNARAAGLNYVSIEVPTKAPTEDQVAAFAQIVNDPATYPVLVHCESANRVGAMWALYRAANGVSPEIAVQEGRTVGLKPSREAAVRQMLGLPPLAK